MWHLIGSPRLAVHPIVHAVDQFEYVLERLASDEKASSLPNWCENLIHVPTVRSENPPSHTPNGSNNNDNNRSRAATSPLVRKSRMRNGHDEAQQQHQQQNKKNGINKSKTKQINNNNDNNKKPE